MFWWWWVFGICGFDLVRVVFLWFDNRCLLCYMYYWVIVFDLLWCELWNFLFWNFIISGYFFCCYFNWENWVVVCVFWFVLYCINFELVVFGIGSCFGGGGVCVCVRYCVVFVFVVMFWEVDFVMLWVCLCGEWCMLVYYCLCFLVMVGVVFFRFCNLCVVFLNFYFCWS